MLPYDDSQDAAPPHFVSQKKNKKKRKEKSHDQSGEGGLAQRGAATGGAQPAWPQKGEPASGAQACRGAPLLTPAGSRFASWLCIYATRACGRVRPWPCVCRLIAIPGDTSTDTGEHGGKMGISSDCVKTGEHGGQDTRPHTPAKQTGKDMAKGTSACALGC